MIKWPEYEMRMVEMEKEDDNDEEWKIERRKPEGLLT